MRLKAILVALLVSFNLMAQEDPQNLRYSVSGTVIDSENGRALQYVTVTIPGMRYATVTNADGGFTIKSADQPERIEFNLLGYKTSWIGMPADNAPVTVKMVKSSLTLDAARVISGNPYTIMGEAIEKIRDNYPAAPELFDCFYRETVQKRHRFIFVSEAVGRMLKTTYARNTDGDRITVDKSRVLVSSNKRDTLSVKVVGGPAQAVDLDIVKNQALLTPEELSKYILVMDPPESIGDRLQFAIRLVPAFNTDYPLYEGTIYIDSETLAFTRFDLSLDMSDKEKVTRAILLGKPAGLRFTPTEVRIRYDYNQEDGVSRVSYVRISMRFKCDWKKKLIRSDFTAISELVTTDRHSGDITVIPRKESFGRRDALSDMAAANYDPEFWKDYNIIEPTESLDRAIEKIVKQSDKD